MLKECRKALRITTEAYDSELCSLMKAAAKDLEIAGVIIPGTVSFSATTTTAGDDEYNDNSSLEDELVARHLLANKLSAIRDELEFLPLPLSENGLHILVRRSLAQHRDIARRFDAAIQAMSDDGSYAATLQRHSP